MVNLVHFMRRLHGPELSGRPYYPPSPGGMHVLMPTQDSHISSPFETENLQLEADLQAKVASLRSLSLHIGDEVREQNIFLGSMTDAFERSEGLLRSTMSRLGGLRRHGALLSTGLYCYIILFVLFFFLVCWVLIKIS
ncbi:unnamed protein product [Protopolystoma xenopodis]|uniref:t-SNARE coiled-coil homology domain-containing protein n=1 Tax=Protopolystoma xenopodis TaxID=117903 RepID=A0A3S5BR90_9PLAT|nr:unnamed protein product [Protopolystoma xenopodis]